MKLGNTFDVGKITIPLLTEHTMIDGGHEKRFSKQENSVRLKGPNEKINLCNEGRLFMLDLWVRVPVDVAWTNPFVWQVAQA